MHVREHVRMTDAECILGAWTARGGVVWPGETEPRRLVIGGITVEEAFKAMRITQFPNADAFRNAIQAHLAELQQAAAKKTVKPGESPPAPDGEVADYTICFVFTMLAHKAYIHLTGRTFPETTYSDSLAAILARYNKKCVVPLYDGLLLPVLVDAVVRFVEELPTYVGKQQTKYAADLMSAVKDKEKDQIKKWIAANETWPIQRSETDLQNLQAREAALRAAIRNI
jgi:hypothetical protein